MAGFLSPGFGHMSLGTELDAIQGKNTGDSQYHLSFLAQRQFQASLPGLWQLFLRDYYLGRGPLVAEECVISFGLPVLILICYQMGEEPTDLALVLHRVLRFAH